MYIQLLCFLSKRFHNEIGEIKKHLTLLCILHLDWWGYSLVGGAPLLQLVCCGHCYSGLLLRRAKTHCCATRGARHSQSGITVSTQ